MQMKNRWCTVEAGSDPIPLMSNCQGQFSRSEGQYHQCLSIGFRCDAIQHSVPLYAVPPTAAPMALPAKMPDSSRLWQPLAPPPPRVSEGPNESAKFGEVANNKILGAALTEECHAKRNDN